MLLHISVTFLRALCLFSAGKMLLSQTPCPGASVTTEVTHSCWHAAWPRGKAGKLLFKLSRMEKAEYLPSPCSICVPPGWHELCTLSGHL